MIQPQEDGITHINIYSKGLTELGRMLTNFSKYPIHTQDGDFMSVEGYWYWLSIEPCEERDVFTKILWIRGEEDRQGDIKNKRKDF